MHADKASSLLSDAEALVYAAKHNWALKKYQKTKNKTESKIIWK